MTHFGTDVDTALAGTIVTIVGAIEIILPTYNLRLADAAVVKFDDGRLFVSDDDNFGAIGSIDTLTDGVGDNAPVLNLTLFPKNDTAAADLSSADVQNSPVNMWLVVLDNDDRSIIGDPELLFAGILDVPTLKSTDKGRQLDYVVTSIFEDFFTTNDAVRLTSAFHKSIWSGENGLKGMTAVKKQIYWGAAAPDSGVKTSKGLDHVTGSS